MIFSNNKHRQIEKDHGCKRGSLKEAVKDLLKRKANLDEVVKGCADYCKVYPGTKFEVAFNLYVSCLKHPKEKLKEETPN